MTATKRATVGSPLADDPETGFGLVSPLGPALVAGEQVPMGGVLDHDEYGQLEVAAIGHSNGALGTFLKLAPVETDAGDVPAQWSLDPGAPNSLPDAYAANEIAVADADP